MPGQSVTEPATTVPGFYGKLPAVGDFVSRRLPREFVDRWDRWLQEATAASRGRLQDRWLDLYLTAPMWRFALAPGVCGEVGWAGVLMPSVDRVGRYFPMTIAVALPAGAASLVVAPAWYERAEQAALSALEGEGANVEQFDGAVAALGPVSVPVPDDDVPGPVGGLGSVCRLPLVRGDDVPQLMPTIAHVLLEQQLGPYSVWWSEGSEHVEPQLLLCAGLPPADGFSDMLGAGWRPEVWDVWPRYRLPRGEPSEVSSL